MSSAEAPRILEELAGQLPEAWLARCLPGREAGDVRLLLRQLAAALRQEPAPVAAAGAAAPVIAATSGRCCLCSDGASRGNPGPAGGGYVLLDDQGRDLAAEAIFLGICTNNVAEYRALLAGLAAARHLGCRELDIRLDSELVVRQLQGRYQVKHPDLKPLFQNARELLALCERWSVRHIPRAENSRADRLANRGIDDQAKSAA